MTVEEFHQDRVTTSTWTGAAGLTFVFMNQGNFPTRQQGSGLLCQDIGQITREILQIDPAGNLRRPASF
jgi:hypothetical protein